MIVSDECDDDGLDDDDDHDDADDNNSDVDGDVMTEDVNKEDAVAMTDDNAEVMTNIEKDNPQWREVKTLAGPQETRPTPPSDKIKVPRNAAVKALS